MVAGLLTENIEIYTPHVSKNEVGEQVIEYVYKNRTKARKVNKGGNRDIENNEIVYNYTKTFEVRIYVDVEEFDYIKYNNKFYRILEIDINKEQHKITIETELVNE